SSTSWRSRSDLATFAVAIAAFRQKPPGGGHGLERRKWRCRNYLNPNVASQGGEGVATPGDGERNRSEIASILYGRFGYDDFQGFSVGARSLEPLLPGQGLPHSAVQPTWFKRRLRGRMGCIATP